MTALNDRIQRARVTFVNKRRARRPLPPWIVLTLNGPINELPEFRPSIPFENILSRYISLPEGAQSVVWLRWVFDRLADDPRVKGVVLKINCAASGAVFESLHAEILRFRARGKQVVAYAEQFGPFQYLLACACDRIYMPPPAEWNVLGFSEDYIFFKDALERIGVGVDVINVSPFKSAGDQFARTGFSDQSRAQAEWLLDARYDALVAAIAAGRKFDPVQARALIDGAPYSSAQAVSHGLIDAALYEDELEHALEPVPPAAPEKPDRMTRLITVIERMAPPLAKQMRSQLAARAPGSKIWQTFGQAAGTLLIRRVEYHDKAIGIVPIEGLIVRGDSAARRPVPIPIPFFGDAVTAGSITVARALRRAERDDDIAAVILYINSSGGDALASDLIGREVARLKIKKPVVALMSGVAASGGYYVAAPAQHIIARPLTITGSIGVIAMKPHIAGAYDKLSLHHEALARGAHAGVYADIGPLTDASRAVIERSIARTYGEFKQMVADGRKLPVDDLEPLCGGKVWTGRQALGHKLVDSMGGFFDAMDLAAKLAGISGKPANWHLMNPSSRFALPPVFPASAELEKKRRSACSLRK